MRLNRSSRALAGSIITLLLATLPGVAREIHVAKTGDDAATGDRDHPLLTVSMAAEVAQAGDVVTIHAGTYREWVKPARGGSGETARIVYRAAVGESPVIKGSERIRAWQSVGDGVWKVVLPNAFFGDYNPYALQVSGGWLNYGQWHHRGDVYLNGLAFYEQHTAADVARVERSWYCETEAMTTIVANFGSADPNQEVTEINVRECLFMPDITGLNYVALDGLHFQHAAANWAPPVIPLQTGAVGTRMGKGWIIQNCTISDVRCVGIILGQAPGADYADIDSYGGHVVRNNIIRRCGQAGIAGQKGATRCLIEHNLIEQTNYRKEFGGWETAAIKFHHSVDTVIRGNLIRGVYHQIEGAFGIWMDFGNQGTRITGNIIHGTQAAAIFLEMDHGPTLVDNNVVLGGGFRSNSENTVVAHNLLADCPIQYAPDTGRRSEYYTPHTTQVIGRKEGVPANEKWMNNIFIRSGLAGVPAGPGFAADSNVFLEGAQGSTFGDQHSVVDDGVTQLRIEDSPLGVTVRFSVKEAALQVAPPLVDAALVGIFPTVEQTIEDGSGKPLRVDTDFHQRPRTRPVAGPLADLHAGEHVITWSAGTK